MPSSLDPSSPGRSRRRRSATGLVAGLLVGLMATIVACSAPPVTTFDPERDDVVAARGEARLRAADALATAAGDHVAQASARMDSCVQGEDNWKRTDPWAVRCFFSYATAISVGDIASAAQTLASGLTALGCEDPEQLASILDRWSELNPGEPGPTSPDFRPGVIPPQLHSCGEVEVWTRISSSADPLLEETAMQAAQSTDPIVVSTRPFRAGEIERLREETGVVIFITVVRMYHEEPR